MAKAKYWVKIGDEWYPCALAKRRRGSRLHFDLYDGSGGVAMHGEWRMAGKTLGPENRPVNESNKLSDQR
jgi:hypothetical protein